MSPSESTPDIQALIEEAREMLAQWDRVWDKTSNNPIPERGVAASLRKLIPALSALSGETETEWGNAYIAQAGEVHPNLSERDARELARQYPQWRRLVSRAVTFGPWIEVTK